VIGIGSGINFVPYVAFHGCFIFLFSSSYLCYYNVYYFFSFMICNYSLISVYDIFVFVFEIAEKAK